VRHIAFSLTTPQVLGRSKTVTRRAGYGWMTLRRGQLLQAIEKGQGLKKGEQVKTLAAITPDDVRAEGFGDLAPHDFVAFFCRTHKGIHPTSEVVRMEFEYVDGVEDTAAPRKGRARR